MSHVVVPRSTYYMIFAALLTLTAVTVGVTYIHMGRFNLIVALLIAITKASLVVLFFMNVKNSSPLTKLFVVAGLFWMGLLDRAYLQRLRQPRLARRSAVLEFGA